MNIANSINFGDENRELFKKADILFDTSDRQISNLGELLKTYGKDKFAFGTHSPILDYLTGLLRIESLREAEAYGETKELKRPGYAKRILEI